MFRRQLLSWLPVAVALGLPALINPGLVTGTAWAACFEEPYTTACLQEWTLCSGVRGDCSAGKNQLVQDGAFGCKTTFWPTECRDGSASTNNADCYDECNCTLRDGSCKIGENCQTHYHVLKVSATCGGY
jgi:hypothetical protein